MLLCARCLGCAIGQIAGAVAFLAGWAIPAGACLLLMCILLCDWLIQERFGYPSTNPRRLVTGTLGSLGLTSVWLTVWSDVVELVAGRL